MEKVGDAKGLLLNLDCAANAEKAGALFASAGNHRQSHSFSPRQRCLKVGVLRQSRFPRKVKRGAELPEKYVYAAVVVNAKLSRVFVRRLKVENGTAAIAFSPKSGGSLLRLLRLRMPSAPSTLPGRCRCSRPASRTGEPGRRDGARELGFLALPVAARRGRREVRAIRPVALG